MAENFIQPPANTGAGLKVRTFEVIAPAGPAAGTPVEMEAYVQCDPINPNVQAAVTLLHQNFNQPIPTGGSALNSGVAQIQNASGKLDPTLEAGQDSIPGRGIPASMTYLAQQAALTTCAQNVPSSAAPVNLTVLSSVGFVIGGVAIIDSQASGVQEGQVITAVPDSTHVTVDHLNNPHNGTVTPFLVAMFVCNQARDASGEQDVALGIGAPTATEYEYDGITYLRGRNIFGVSGLYTDSVAANATASPNPVALIVAGTPPANLQIGHALIIDPLGATPEMQQIIAINIGTKTITVKSLTNNHTGVFRVFAAIQSLSAAPQNLSGVGVAAEAAMVYSGQNGTTGVQQFSVEKDINAVGTALPLNPTIGSNTTAGMDADVEFGVVDTSSRTFSNSTLVPDQHGQGGEDLTTIGGRLTFAITQAAVQASNVIVKGLAGRLCKLVVTTVTAAVPLIITDGPGGTVIAVIPSGTAAGTIYDLQMPVLISILVAQAATWTGAVTASYY